MVVSGVYRGHIGRVVLFAMILRRVWERKEGVRLLFAAHMQEALPSDGWKGGWADMLSKVVYAGLAVHRGVFYGVV